MSNIVIQVEHLSKQYRLGIIGGRRLADDVSRWWAKARKKADPTLKIGQESQTRFNGQEFKALQDVSFEVNQGEILGIIGRNGAGKSTLLKILSRVTAPTTGEVRVKGRIASLLEVGTGFHPELTGRENIFLNGAILGMTKFEIKTKFDEIVAFSGVEDFIDTPVKRYSSGMYVRLAFAVAAHLEPEILIVDEVLAVGDQQFQKKCIGKMKDVSKGGRTVLFVSHNLPSVRRLCSRALLLCSGKITAQGETHRILTHYQAVTLHQQARREWAELSDAPGSEICRIRRIRVTNETNVDISVVDVSGSFIVEIVFDVLENGHSLVPNFHFFNEEGQCLFVAQDLDPLWRGKPRPVGRYCCRLFIPGNFLAEGRLTIGGAVTTLVPFFIHAYAQDAVGIVVEDSCCLSGSRGDYMGPLPGVVRPLLETSNHYSPFSAGTTLANV